MDYKNMKRPFFVMVFDLIRDLILLGTLSYCFYKSIIGFIALLPSILVLQKYHINKYRIKRISQLELEFKEFLLCVSNGITAGYSIENSMLSSKENLEILYGEKSDICAEIKELETALKNNLLVEEYMRGLGIRTGSESIVEFGNVLSIGKKTGGNLSQMIRNSAYRISNAIQFEEELQVKISAGKYQLKIMSCMPFLILFYIELTNPKFFEPLYYNFTGISVMTGCLILYVTAYFTGMKLMDIRM